MSKDGGPAFPCAPVLHEGGPESYWSQAGQGGMSLRDYFAAKAMHAELTTSGVPGESVQALVAAADAAGREVVDQLAFNAYEMADAMLKAREQ